MKLRPVCLFKTVSLLVVSLCLVVSAALRDGVRHVFIQRNPVTDASTRVLSSLQRLQQKENCKI